ncbi:uncharacterized protein LOC112568899 [Pomacea canaliculata]|uniref:uncharacterized protein LOC112568899 n=1 Tax=Pomacea canaliculata TaxID=400727 RepID=UPI000D725719|nr:uncharacterized protein LOC112568899 [Pomacea canaliculata]
MEIMLKKHLLLITMLFWGNIFTDGLQNNTEDKPDVSKETTTLTVKDNNVQSTDNSFTIKVASGCTGGGVAFTTIVSVMWRILKKRRSNKNNYGDKNNDNGTPWVNERVEFIAEDRNGFQFLACTREIRTGREDIYQNNSPVPQRIQWTY